MRKIFYTVAFFLFFVICLALPAPAQKVELAIGAGGYFPVNVAGISSAAAIEGTIGYRVLSVPLVSAYVELPVVGTLNSHVTSLGLASSASYSALFVAPGVKVKLAPGFFLSPWVAAGGGLAHFSGNSGVFLSGGSGSSNSGVFDVGGGLDAKIAPFVSLRGEVRDFYSGSLGLNLVTFNENLHNVVATAGLVLRF